MGNKVTFDYSKAKSFIRDHEIEYMKKIAGEAKDRAPVDKGFLTADITTQTFENQKSLHFEEENEH